MDRTYPVEEEPTVEARRLQLLHERCGAAKKSVCNEGVIATGEQTVNSWSTEFKPRPAVEKQKNAVTVDRSVKQLITTTVLNKLLTVAIDLIEIPSGQTWNKGG